jgi:hypothetical protein
VSHHSQAGPEADEDLPAHDQRPQDHVAQQLVVSDDLSQPAGHGSRRFLGELGLVTGQPVFLTGVVVERGEVLVVQSQSPSPSR